MMCGSLDLWLHKITKQNRKSEDKYQDVEWSFDEPRLRSFIEVDYLIIRHNTGSNPKRINSCKCRNNSVFSFPRYMFVKFLVEN